MAPRLLSKSRYINGLQCPKYLWTLFHDPNKIPEPDASTQYIFDQGHLVGELSKGLFPDGVNIPDESFMGNIRQTRELLKQRTPLFEAGITTGSIYARVDILNPVGADDWDIIEVKSSTSVKDVHIEDAAFQRFCCQESGLEIRKCFLTYINNQYVRHGDIDVGQLFITQDISDEVKAASTGLSDRIHGMFEVISWDMCPDNVLGKHCSDPYPCPLTDDCQSFLPEHNVLELYYGGKKSLQLLETGVTAIGDIPDSFKLNLKQQIQKDSVLYGKPYVDKVGIGSFLSGLRYPICYLDFETFNPGVPMFDGTRPYQRIPFQFSLHIVTEEDAKPKHFSFLASGVDDPRPEFLKELIKVLGKEGSIVAYNDSFEEGVLRELSDAFPEHDERVNQVIARMADLLSPFRGFNYYHPSQKGSASLKAVLPALTGRGYNELNISDGDQASIAFQQVTYGDVPQELRNTVRADLEEYCGRDTEGMIWIVERLRDLCD